MLDLVVLGEVALDVLDGCYCRPGGVMYSALASRSIGARAGIIGHIGPQGEGWVRELLAQREVDQRHLFSKPGQTTLFTMRNTNEVEATVCDKLQTGVPTEARLGPIETEALLLYSYPPEWVHRAIEACHGAKVAFDLQYDMGDLDQLGAILKRCNIVFASRKQGLSYFGVSSVEELARTLLSFGPEIVVIKFGLGGSAIYTRGQQDPIPVPRFAVSWRQSVGAGDVYNAVFLTAWISSGNVRLAATRASAAAALFCEDDGSCLLGNWELEPYLERESIYVHPDVLAKQQIYLAGPFFNEPQLSLVTRVQDMLEHHGLYVYCPHQVDGVVESANPFRRAVVYDNNLTAIDRSCALVALLDGSDPGTLYEYGYAVARGIPVVGIWTSNISELNLMPRLGGTIVRSLDQVITVLLELLQQGG